MGSTWPASSRLDCRDSPSVFPAAVPVAVAGLFVLAPLQLASCALPPYSGVAYLPGTDTYLSRTRQELCPGTTAGPSSKRTVGHIEKGERHHATGRTARH